MSKKLVVEKLTIRAEKAANAFIATMRGYGFLLIETNGDGFCMEQNTDSLNALHISTEFRKSTKTKKGYRDHMSISFYSYGVDGDEKETNRVISIYDKVPAREVAVSIGVLTRYEAGVSEGNQKGN